MKTRRLLIRLFLFSFSVITIITSAKAQESTPETVPYIWKNVQYVGGGFVDGIVFHPHEKGLCYCRTDMGGAYRRNPEIMRWEPLLDWLSYADRNLMGVESIALDPMDPNRVYLSCGTYTNPRTPNGAILRSNDRGRTFIRTDVPFKMGGNEDGRGNGERMMVDPNNGNIIYLGTRHAGLWKSTDTAVTWSRVHNFPDVTERAPASMHNADSIAWWLRTNRGSGIIFVLFDPLSGSNGQGSKTIYVGVSLMNRPSIFRSTDAGETWQPLPGQPVQYRPTHAVLAADGTLYITYGNMPGPSPMTNGGVWKFSSREEVWTDITPDKPEPATRAFGYAAVAVQQDNPNVLIVSSFNRYDVDNGEDIFRSTDGGKTWKKVFGCGGIIDSRLAPYTAHTGIHWLFDLEIDPFNPDHALFTTGYGGHETFDLTAMDKGQPTTWGIMSTGIEETVPLELLSPPKGAHLVTAIGDYGGAVHWDLDQPAADNFSNPRFGNTNGIACAENKPEIMVRVGRATGDNPEKTIGYSLDNGRTWSPTDTLPHPLAALGDIAVSADGFTWIWAPDPAGGGYGSGTRRQVLPVYYTTDKGKTWHECAGIPGNTRVIADRVNSDLFYGVDIFTGKLFISRNGGENFSVQAFELPGGLPVRSADRGDSRGGQDRIYATPGKEGELWLAAFDGLYRAENTGKTFNQMPVVEEIHGFGFGKGVSADYPALYLIGTIAGVRGIFRSDDAAATWVKISDDQRQWGLLMHITGDPKQYGRVYVGTHGRGTLYGDPL